MVTTTTEPDAAEITLADYSVCMRTNGGLVYLSEFRTLPEAVQIAETALRSSGAVILIRQNGNEVRELRPDVSSATH